MSRTLPAKSASAMLCALGIFLVATDARADDRSWMALEKLRSTLTDRSPLTATFVQTLIPAGFDAADADRESGRLSMNLPDCLRWDYLGDFEKSFLLCDQLGWYWNPGEAAGERFDLQSIDDAPGLDFFLQPTSVLRYRYRANSNQKGNRLTIDLVPTRSNPEVVSLQVRIDRSTNLLETLSYQDVDGNRTTFRMDSYGDGANAVVFRPPDLYWEDR